MVLRRWLLREGGPSCARYTSCLREHKSLVGLCATNVRDPDNCGSCGSIDLQFMLTHSRRMADQTPVPLRTVGWSSVRAAPAQCIQMPATVGAGGWGKDPHLFEDVYVSCDPFRPTLWLASAGRVVGIGHHLHPNPTTMYLKDLSRPGTL